MSDLTGKRTIVYTRVSRDATGEGKSNERQEADCRAFAGLRGYEVVRTETDVSYSAYSGKARPGWERVLDAVRGGEVDVILAWKVDRITRTVRELVSIIDVCLAHDVSVVTVDGDLDLSTPQGRAVATILGSISQMEVERKGERQKSANAQRRAEGKPWRSGWASFGYDRDKKIIPEQAQLIRRGAEKVLSGASLKSIAREWRDSGITTPRSSKGAAGWTHNGVRTILLNPVNAGINTYKGEEIGRGDWEPILPEGTLRQLQGLLADPSRRTNLRPGRTAENLLSGIAICARCGHRVVAGTSNGRKVYKCSNPEGEHLSTDRAEADAFVLSALTSRELFASSSVLPKAAVREGQDALMDELAALNRREQAITEKFSAGAISEETWSRGVASIKPLRDSLTSRISEAGGSDRSQVAIAKARVSSFLALNLADRRVTMSGIADVRLHPRDRKHKVAIDAQISIWAKDSRRLSPLIAGTHPDALRERESKLALRDQVSVSASADGRND